MNQQTISGELIKQGRKFRTLNTWGTMTWGYQWTDQNLQIGKLFYIYQNQVPIMVFS